MDYLNTVSYSIYTMQILLNFDSFCKIVLKGVYFKLLKNRDYRVTYILIIIMQKKNRMYAPIFCYIQCIFENVLIVY